MQYIHALKSVALSSRRLVSYTATVSHFFFLFIYSLIYCNVESNERADRASNAIPKIISIKMLLSHIPTLIVLLNSVKAENFKIKNSVKYNKNAVIW